MAAKLDIEDIWIAGYAQRIPLRIYRPVRAVATLPIVLYFHGGGFVTGSVNDADATAQYLAEHTEALVVSVGYSLAPDFPFPAALEDGYLAAKWALSQSAGHRASPCHIVVAGDDAGGNLAAGLVLMARDRGEFAFSGQALLTPLLDPGMTRLGDARTLDSDVTLSDCARWYSAYLPTLAQRMHPYSAPIESRRLAGLPASMIASAEHDILHIEAEQYAAALIAAGVPTQITRYRDVSHRTLATHRPALDEVAVFFRRWLASPPTH